MTGPALLEGRYGASNYAPLPVTIVRGNGIYVWDEKNFRASFGIGVVLAGI
jgi:ornithine--oxo-acid transaminase